MKILFVADVVGKQGRRAVKTHVPRLRKQGVDLVIANGENAARGLGITPKLAKELLNAGVDVLTSGNHLFRRAAEIVPMLQKDPRLLRPHNFRTRAPGKGWGVFETRSCQKVGIFNLCGQLYMDPADDPVAAADSILTEQLADVPIRILDFHAEATGEKRALMHWLDGRVTAVIGTHTHVQTADEYVTDKGTACICDAGLTGAPGSVIGMDAGPILETIRTGLPTRYRPASEGVEMQGVMLEVDEATGKATSITRIREPIEDLPPK